MNNSGRAVKKLILNLKSEILNLFVIHDDIDLPLGKIRISKGRGAAGHKGVESIIKELGTPKESLPIPSLPASYGAGRLPTRQAKNFIRFRIGIQPETGKPKSIESFVLQKFNKEEEKILKEVIKKTVGTIEFALIEGVEKAMNKYSQ
jgi:PTH1 family peptidyl-tRNA hydrolase